MTDARCTGHCCRVIHVGDGATRRHLEELAIRCAFNETTIKRVEGGVDDHVREPWFIADMLRPLVGPSPIEGDPRWFTEADRRFSCRHFDGRDCTVYEERPRMCRDYPYGGPCPTDGCTALVQIT